MGKVLRIEDAETIIEKGSRIKRYVFNDDKVVRVEIGTDRVITKNVPEVYMNLISLYDARIVGKTKEEEDLVEKELKNKARRINSGKGAGLGVFLGILLKFTIIGPVIAGLFSFSFLNDISDEEYLRNTNAEDINFRKGFYATAVFGLIVAIICCSQWKTDMISVLDGDPSRQSRNRHLCFKIWFLVSVAYEVLSIIFSLSFYTTVNITPTNTTTYYHRSY